MVPKPNFFVIGAPKSGTTSLTKYLQSHPNIYMSDPKEPNYFATDMEGQRAVRNESRYMELFNQATEKHLAIGEASVWYLYSKEAAENIKLFNKEAKLIAMLRNPLDMVYSLHSQQVFTLNEDERDFSRAWFLEEQRKKGKRIPKSCRAVQNLYYSEVARYGEQLERVYKYFQKEKVFLIFYEDFKADTRKVYQDLLRFLGLPAYELKKYPAYNKSKRNRSEIFARLTKRPPRELVELAWYIKRFLGLRRFGFGRILKEMNTEYAERPQLSTELKKFIIMAYQSDIFCLSELTGRDLSEWIELE
jgi:hypothetical protein